MIRETGLKLPIPQMLTQNCYMEYICMKVELDQNPNAMDIEWTEVVDGS